LDDVADDENEDERLEKPEGGSVVFSPADREQHSHRIERDVGDAQPEDENRAPWEVEEVVQQESGVRSQGSGVSGNG